MIRCFGLGINWRTHSSIRIRSDNVAFLFAMTQWIGTSLASMWMMSSSHSTPWGWLCTLNLKCQLTGKRNTCLFFWLQLRHGIYLMYNLEPRCMSRMRCGWSGTWHPDFARCRHQQFTQSMHHQELWNGDKLSKNLTSCHLLWISLLFASNWSVLWTLQLHVRMTLTNEKKNGKLQDSSARTDIQRLDLKSQHANGILDCKWQKIYSRSPCNMEFK